MAQPNRQQLVSRAIVARRPARSGGTTAPRSAAGGPRLGQNRPAPRQKTGIASNRPARGGGTGGGAAPGPGGSAGASVAPGRAPTPWNSAAENIVAGARRNYLGAQANFDLAEKEAKQDYGLDSGFNDYKANPYSRAALLEQSYQNANRGTMNSAGLQLYSGSTSNALGANRSTRDLNYNDLASAYREALGQITVGRTEAAEKKAEEEREAEWRRIEAAERSEPDAEASPAPGGGGGSSGGGKPKGKSKGGGGGKGPAIAPRRKAR
jgi:hypothetical protein